MKAASFYGVRLFSWGAEASSAFWLASSSIQTDVPPPSPRLHQWSPSPLPLPCAWRLRQRTRGQFRWQVVGESLASWQRCLWKTGQVAGSSPGPIEASPQCCAEVQNHVAPPAMPRSRRARPRSESRPLRFAPNMRRGHSHRRRHRRLVHSCVSVTGLLRGYRAREMGGLSTGRSPPGWRKNLAHENVLQTNWPRGRFANHVGSVNTLSHRLAREGRFFVARIPRIRGWLAAFSVSHSVQNRCFD